MSSPDVHDLLQAHGGKIWVEGSGRWVYENEFPDNVVADAGTLPELLELIEQYFTPTGAAR